VKEVFCGHKNVKFGLKMNFLTALDPLFLAKLFKLVAVF
jgi:hypothetical protein